MNKVVVSKLVKKKPVTICIRTSWSVQVALRGFNKYNGNSLLRSFEGLQ
jgi:hypothetical protein